MSSSRKNSSDSTNSLLSLTSSVSMTSFKSYDSAEPYFINEEKANFEEKTFDNSNNLFIKSNKISKSRERDEPLKKETPSPNIDKWKKVLEEKTNQDIVIEKIVDIEETLEF